MLSKTIPDSSLFTQYADPWNGALQCSQIQPIYQFGRGHAQARKPRVSPFGRSHCNFTTPEKLCGKYYRLQQHDRNSLNGSWSLVCRWCGRKRESFSAAQKKFLYRWRQLFPEACRASLLSIPLNCVSVWPATYSRTIGWHEIEASPEKRTLPCQARSDQFH